MSKKIIKESGMSFEVETENSFHIEQNSLLKKIEGCKVCEFIHVQNNELQLIEAKQSAPKPHNCEPFHEFVNTIKDKFSNSLQIFMAYFIGRYTSEKFPENLKNIPLANIEIKFYLVIKNFQKEWLQPINAQLKQDMKLFLKNWNIKEVGIKVMNDIQAKDKGLIQ